MTATPCYHCGEPVPASCDIHTEQHGLRRDFCCYACCAISQTISDSQLDDYYQLRDSRAKPPRQLDFSVWDHPDSLKQWLTIEQGRARTQLFIEGMHCTACAWLIEKYLGRNPHIHKASVMFEQSRLDIEWDINQLPLSAVMQLISTIGYTPYPFQSDIIKQRQLAENRALLKRIGITGILMMQIGMFSIGLYAGDYLGISDHHRQLLRVFSLIFSLPLLYYGALPFFSAAFFSLKNRQVSINLSIALAITGLYSSSFYSVMSGRGEIYFDSAAMFCLFILTARYIEKKSRSDIQPSQPVLPAFVIRIDQGRQYQTSLDDIAIDDQVLVPEGAIIPLDGIVLEGHSSVSEAFINGESAPLRKQADSHVYAGSQNHDGQLLIRVSQLPEQSLLNRISQLSQLAAEEKPLFVSITDRIAARFTLTIFTLTALTWLYWQGLDADRAFWVALSVLVVSCPCALSLAAPTALSSVHYRLRQQGIFIRSARVLETLNRVSHAVFDKTGTLTCGSFSLNSVICLNHSERQQNLLIAAALEKNARHPLAQAFRVDEELPLACALTIYPNQGIEGQVNGHDYRIGSPAFCQQWQPISPPDQHQQWLGLCSREQMLAWFSVSDSLRPEAATLIQSLQQQGIATEILSGDSSSEVEKAARKLGIDNYQKACSSEQKLQQLQQHQHQGHITLMVGDGINDAPVLAASDVSATLLMASDYVKNNADMVLLNNRLDGILAAMHSARQYRRILIQNFLWAFSYNLLAIPFAMAGLVTPWMAALGMSLSSVIVVLNSRRLARNSSRSSTASNIASSAVAVPGH